ncbi:P-loop containing nucleoside triphosphate hydrolases superfamily protein [Actinidia rufa]|uniref:RNA helicase n=1 Tax=Actinidia rufa TaxID=165716 RepID=A0A7J0DDX3_9ERIC|nr:P-loop containing nucleoside triphosphate hydrolases superfamily protein [Actinidia rufa]
MWPKVATQEPPTPRRLYSSVLTKAQREQLALQRREEEIAEQKRCAEQILLHNYNLPSSNSKPSSDPSHDSTSRYQHRSSRDRDYERDRERNRERERHERRNRDREREKEQNSRERARLEKLAECERDKELEPGIHKRAVPWIQKTYKTEDFNISYKGSKIPRPMRSWAESRLSGELLKAVERAGYKKPSPIQMTAIPLGLQQRDVIGNEAEGPYAVVMAPTREFAQQFEDESVKFAHYLGIKLVSIVGGQSIEAQGFKIRQGCEVVIATPGRLIDCLERRYAVSNQCNYVVLDEADRMIDMGFEPQVVGKATDLITQHVIMMMKESEKLYKLQKLLDELGYKTATVFINTKKSADILSRALDKAGYRVTTLHGGKSQEERDVSLEGFRTKRYNVLVATDVAGRGVDIPYVAHVINYDMPGNIEMYTHRIGRTGRVGKTGVATTFLTLHDTDVFYDLKQILIQSNSPVPPELARHEHRSIELKIGRNGHYVTLRLRPLTPHL